MSDKSRIHQELEPDDDTQTTEKGLKIGVPKKSRFMVGLEKASKSEK